MSDNIAQPTDATIDVSTDSLMEQDSELVDITRYNPVDQLTVADLDSLWPEWREGEPWNTETPEEREANAERILFDFVRTTEERRIRAETGLPGVAHIDEGLTKALNQMPKEVGSRFQGHGITGKSGSSSTELDTLLQNGVETDRIFYTTELMYNPEAVVLLVLICRSLRVVL